MEIPDGFVREGGNIRLKTREEHEAEYAKEFEIRDINNNLPSTP